MMTERETRTCVPGSSFMHGTERAGGRCGDRVEEFCGQDRMDQIDVDGTKADETIACWASAGSPGTEGE